MTDFSFDPSSHTYTLNGRVLSSVTELVAILGKDIDSDDPVVERAADRGSFLHAFISDYLNGADYDELLDETPADYGPYAVWIKAFFEQHDITVMLTEEPFYCAELNYAGTPDLVAEYKGQLAIFDFKFVSQVAKTKVKAQLNGYATLLRNNGIFPEALYAVQFMRDGYRMYPVKMDVTEFAHCLNNRDYMNKKHPRGKIE